MAEFIKNPKNSYLFGALALFVTVYGPRLSPKLPQPIQQLFENSFFRASVMFLAIYIAQRDIKVALVVTIIFMLLMNVVQNTNVFETFLQNYERSIENFQDLTDSMLSPGQMQCKSTLVTNQNASKVPVIYTAARESGNEAGFAWNKTLKQANTAQGAANVAQQVTDWCKLHEGNYVGAETAGINPACSQIVSACDNQFSTDNRGLNSTKKITGGQTVCNPINVNKNQWTIKDGGSDSNKLNFEKQTKLNGEPVTVRCVQNGYGKGCYKHPISGQLKRTSKTSTPNLRNNRVNPLGTCIPSSGTQPNVTAGQCNHSGQCCEFDGNNNKGAKCVKNDGVSSQYGQGADVIKNKKFCINPTGGRMSTTGVALSDIQKQGTMGGGGRGWLSAADLHFSSEEGVFGSSVIPAPAHWNTNLDGNKYPNESDVTFPTIYTDGNNVGRGCWMMNAEPSPATKPRSNLDANLTDLGNDIPSHTASLSQAYSSPGTLQNVPIRGDKSLHIPLELKKPGTNFTKGRDGTYRGRPVVQGNHNVKEQFVGSRNSNYQDQLHETNQINGAPVGDCGNYNQNSVDFTGTAFYPLNDTNQYQQQRGEGQPYSEEPLPYEGELYK